MIINQYIKNFENLGMGMFVHFGLYSILKNGEWVMDQHKIPLEEYKKNAKMFCPEKDWAEQLVKTAKNGGAKYITLTTRHHEGFSLYDTCGLSDYDAPHYIGRDLVREFVDACNAEGIIPCFYHTTLDWSMASFYDDFPAYLNYLRKSVEVLCRNYGKIGSFWFDGNWSKKDVDWEEDALYQMIRSYQPETIIINNTGLEKLGERGNIHIDSVTFERGKPFEINPPDAPKYLASEMCEVLGSHWGYAEHDLFLKSPKEIIETLCQCRRFGANLLINVGLKENGYVSDVEQAYFSVLGKWVFVYGEAIRCPRPSHIVIENNEKDFILRDGKSLYLFCHNLGMSADPNVSRITNPAKYVDSFKLPDEKILSAKWMDNGESLSFSNEDGMIHMKTAPFLYGTNYVVRVAKIYLE